MFVRFLFSYGSMRTLTVTTNCWEMELAALVVGHCLQTSFCLTPVNVAAVQQQAGTGL